MTENENELMRPRDVAACLLISQHTVIRMVERGELSACRVGDQWRIRRESVENLINPNPNGEKR
jgi:excisionase family DNA binding protein